MTDRTPTLAELVASRHVIVCCGSGGVGKTTTAAVLALEGARLGRRAVVVTIDPAKRLADALGLDRLSGQAARITGDWPGELWALMLDTEATFDSLVERYATSPDQADAILHNTFYRNISGALSGTQEYMASEKLFELANDDRFDLVVVDTPPTRNALDFLEAPARLSRFLDHPLYRVVTTPTRGIVRAVNAAAQSLLRRVGKVIGGDVIADALAFFAVFDGMEQGFSERAHHVERLLRGDDTAFVLITSPKRDSVDEARFFAAKLTDLSIAVRAVIVNRIHPLPEPPALEADRATAERFSDTALGDWYLALSELETVALSERANLEEIQAGNAVRIDVPYLAVEVHDLASLDLVADHLFTRSR